MSVWPLLERLNRLTEATLDVRALAEDEVEYHVALQPTLKPEVQSCGHADQVMETAVIVYVNLLRDGILLSGHVLMSKDDVYDDANYVRWIDRLWDSLVVHGIQTFIEGEAFGNGPEPY